MSKPVNTRLVLAIILVFMMGFTLYGVGVPVPTKSPYVVITIETDQQEYTLGEPIHIESSVVNRMPFKIRLEPFYPLSHEVYRVDYNDTRIVSSRNNPEEHITEISPYGKHVLRDMSMGNVSKPGDYLISFTVNDLQATHIVSVN